MTVDTPVVLTHELFIDLVEAAIKAPSSDNMQPWEFRNKGDRIEIYCIEERLLTIDVGNMFTWISIGAAIQNIINAANARSLEVEVSYIGGESLESPVAILSVSTQTKTRSAGSLAEWIGVRRTNRRPYLAEPLEEAILRELMDVANDVDAAVHVIRRAGDLAEMSGIDAVCSSILLEHKPLFDGLFETVRFTGKEMDESKLGMSLESLEIPYLGYLVARILGSSRICRVVSRFGIGRIVARVLASRIRKAGALFLVSIPTCDPAGYMEAGRKMEQLWLDLTARGLSAHPYGVIPQYLTMAELRPTMFLPKHVHMIQGRRDTFFSLFPDAVGRYPAVMLRAGVARRESPRNDIRLPAARVIRNS